MEPFALKSWKGFRPAGGNPAGPHTIVHVTIDSRHITEPDTLFVALKGKKHDGHAYVGDAARRGATYALVRNTWVPPESLPPIRLLRVEDPLESLQEIATLYRKQRGATVIGITGSYGKTMVKELLGEILSQTYRVGLSPDSFNSQIGVPLSLFTLNESHRVALIEASVSLPGEMERLARMIAPHAALVTHVGRKHLVTMGSKERAAHEMAKLLQHPDCREFAFVPDAGFIGRAPCKIWKQPSPDLPFAFRDKGSLAHPLHYTIRYPVGTPYHGLMRGGLSYFLDLINMAIQVAWTMGIPADAINDVLETYRPSRMRTELWRTQNGALIINDRSCSDPLSLGPSLDFFSWQGKKGRKLFLFEGLRKEPTLIRDYIPIASTLSSTGLSELHTTEEIPEGLFAPLYRHPSLSSALQRLGKTMQAGDILLVKGKEKRLPEDVASELDDPLKPTRCLVNLAAIEENIARIRAHLRENSEVMVIVKAFAYGTDSSQIAPFLVERCGIRWLGVSTLDEALSLRQGGISCRIFLIHATPHEAQAIIREGIDVGVSDLRLLEALKKEALQQKKTGYIHLHLNTGMTRFGCHEEEGLRMIETVAETPSLRLVGLMTHLACADDPAEDPFTLRQVARFDTFVAAVREKGIHPEYTHVSASAGALRFAFPQHNMVRIGLAAYGLYASDAVRDACDLHLALSLITRVVAINCCQRGDTVSYGRKFCIEREEARIAVLPLGYHDGLHRHYSESAYVLIHGYKAPIVGTICMDFFMVDVTDIPHVEVGDTALIFGEDEDGHFLAPEELAIKGGSIAHELITCLGPRIQRVFLYEESNTVR